MKIAMIGQKRIPGREGGIEVVVEELSSRMVKLGHRVVVYNRKRKNSIPEKEYKGIKLITIPTIEKKSMDAVVYSFLASFHALFCHYDVIHYHGIGPSVFLVIPHIFGIRTVVTVHGLNYKTPKWKGFGAKFIMLGEKIAAKFADEVIVLSREQQNYFWNRYNRKTTFIPNGVTIQDVIPPVIIQEKYGLCNKKYILFLSRLVPGKGIEYLIRAYKQIKTELPLIIAGDAPFVNEFIMRIKLEAASDRRIRFVGFVEGEELQELYSNAALFVFPSEAEGMPMCLLEAMSYNIPCLVSNIPENVEVGKNYVWTFRNKEINDLKLKLEQLLEENCNKRVDSRAHVAQCYSWDSAVTGTLKCYGGKSGTSYDHYTDL